jgi:acetyl-CoA carboxylase carboxyltransferase component
MDKMEELAHKKKLSHGGGGDDAIQMQHNLKKMTARERIGCVLDEGSFIELGTFSNGNDVVTGYGTIGERLVYVYSEDYTINAGLLSLEGGKKICSVMEMALKMGAPMLQIIDSAGVKISSGLEMLTVYNKVISMNAKLSGVVPQIAVIAGPCTGVAAVGAAMSDITIITENNGELYVNAPVTIEEKEHKHVDVSDYSKAEISIKNGSAQLIAKDDKEALELVKRVFQYLPSNNIEFSPVSNVDFCEKIENTSLNTLIDISSYDIREVINSISDANSVIEFDTYKGEAVITSLVKINGLVTGVIASNKAITEGSLDIKACEKATRFVKLCNSFNISLVTIVNSKGFIASAEEECNGLALAASKLIYTISEATIPKVSLLVGEAYGVAYIAFAGKENCFDVVYAWPGAKVALADPKSIVKVLHKEEIVASEDPKNKETDLINKYIEEHANVYKAAEAGLVDDVIVPSETTLRLYSALDMLQSKRVVKYPKKHGSTLI